MKSKFIYELHASLQHIEDKLFNYIRRLNKKNIRYVPLKEIYESLALQSMRTDLLIYQIENIK